MLYAHDGAINGHTISLAELCEKEWRLHDQTTLECISICFPQLFADFEAKELERIVFEEDYETAPRLLFLELVKLFGKQTHNSSTYGLATAIVYWARHETVTQPEPRPVSKWTASCSSSRRTVVRRKLQAV